MITPYDYHSDSDKHGSYQYLTLKEIVNALELKYSESDHILKHVKRSLILLYAKEGIREYNKQTFKDVLACEITVPENLSFALPHNFVSYVRCSLVVTDTTTDSFRLMPLDINRNINIAEGYLQDHNYEILFDENGGILTSDASNAYNKPYKKYEFTPNSMGGRRELDTAKFSKYGEFTIDERRGKIVFSSDLHDREIVLEYVSDGLQFDTYGENEIRVHKDLVQLINEYVYYACVKGKQNVPLNEKERARRSLRTAEHTAKLNRTDLNLLEISRTMRTASKNL